MTVRGTRNLFGAEAELYSSVVFWLKATVLKAGYQEFVPSALSETEVFVDKAGPEILNQMYAFKDKGDRDICLIPEVTAIVQKLYKDSWSKSLPKPVKLFYLTRCYRYEKPQEGRYREFWQFGVENLGGKATAEEMMELLVNCLKEVQTAVNFEFPFEVRANVKRGLNYYVEDGFEAEVPTLGAQKQVAGGGRYDCGIGWAIGVDRLMLAASKR